MAPAPTIITKKRDSTGGGATTAATGVLSAGAHVTILYLTTSLPSPTGEVTGVLHGVSMEEQHTQATEIFDFLVNAGPNYISWLNEGNRCDIGLVNVQNTSVFKVVYVMEIGSIPIRSTSSPVEGTFYLLQGDGNADLGPPQTIFLPTTLINTNSVAVMTETKLSTAITQKGAGYSYPLLTRNTVTKSKTITHLAPIPPYFVYNSFEQDLDTALVLERIIGVNPTGNDMFTHL